MKQILLITLGLSVALLADFTKNGNIVTDNTTGLEWQITTTHTKIWTAAIEYCESLTLDGHSDWRLPNIRELTSIVDHTKYDPSIDPVLFRYPISFNYWSSTSFAGFSGLAWSIDFKYGYHAHNHKTHNLFVRCVRAGQ